MSTCSDCGGLPKEMCMDGAYDWPCECGDSKAATVEPVVPWNSETWVSGSPWETTTNGTSDPAWDVPISIVPDFPDRPVIGYSYVFDNHTVTFEGPGKTYEVLACNFCGEVEVAVHQYWIYIDGYRFHWCEDCLIFQWEEMINGRYTWP